MPACELNPEAGECFANIRKWYFNSQRNECRMFAYGGCGGNDNRFETREDCEGACMTGGEIPGKGM